MTAPTLWWLMTFALVALELVTGTIYALLVAIGFAVGALAAHLGAAMPTQIVSAAVACMAFVGGWYLRASRRPKARLSDVQIDVGEQDQRAGLERGPNGRGPLPRRHLAGQAGVRRTDRARAAPHRRRAGQFPGRRTHRLMRCRPASHH